MFIYKKKNTDQHICSNCSRESDISMLNLHKKYRIKIKKSNDSNKGH